MGASNEVRLIAVGDIHGEFAALKEVIEKINPTQEDRVIFLGDYIDRGYAIRETLEFLMDFYDEFPESVFLLGNHEEMGLASRNSFSRKKEWIFNGGGETLQQLGEDLEEYLSWIEQSTVLCHKVEVEHTTYYFSHAGWDIRDDLEAQYQAPHEDILLWSRECLAYPGVAADSWKGGTAVFGHTPLEVPLVRTWGIGLDTGAVFGCHLTAAELPLNKNQEIVFHTSHNVRGKVPS